MFGHAVSVYFKEAFDKHGEALKAAGINQNNGLGAVYDGLGALEPSVKARPRTWCTPTPCTFHSVRC